MRDLVGVLAVSAVVASTCRALSAPVETPPRADATANYFTLTRADCADDVKVKTAYGQGVATVPQGDRPAAKANLDALIRVCGAAPAVWPFRTLRAAMAISDNDYDQALSLLKPVSIEATGPLSSVAAWLRLRLYEIKHDAKSFDQERQSILQAADRGLGKSGGRRLEAFSVGPVRVTAYQTALQQGAFHREIEFIVAPPGAFAEPESIMLTGDSGSDQVAAELSASSAKPIAPPIFLDRYNCSSQSLLTMLPAGSGYAAVKAVVVAELTKRPSYGEEQGAKLMVCRWPQFAAPGLGS